MLPTDTTAVSLEAAHDPPPSLTWDTVTKAATLVAVLVPIGPIASRYVGFQISDQVPASLAAAAPPGELAAAGVPLLLLGLVYAALCLGIVAFLGSNLLGPPIDLRTAGRGTILFGLACYGLVPGVVLLFVEFEPGVAASMLTIPVAIGVLVLLRDEHGRVGLIRLIPWALALTVSLGVADGLSPNPPLTPVVTVEFTESTSDLNGSYTLIGVDSGVLYLLPCRVDSRVIRIAQDNVLWMQHRGSDPLPKASLIDVLRGAPLQFGFVSRCQGSGTGWLRDQQRPASA